MLRSSPWEPEGRWRSVDGHLRRGPHSLPPCGCGLQRSTSAPECAWIGMAVASFYGHGEDGQMLAPRLILLDEAFVGIDDAARKHCIALIREFDLDFVTTSEREWAAHGAPRAPRGNVVDLNAEIPNNALDLRMPEPMEKRVARVPKALRRVRSRPFLRGELG